MYFILMEVTKTNRQVGYKMLFIRNNELVDNFMHDTFCLTCQKHQKKLSINQKHVNWISALHVPSFYGANEKKPLS